MKTIVTIKYLGDFCEDIFEVPAGATVKAGDRVLVECGDYEHPGVATQDAIEVEDSIVAYFTKDNPIRKVTAIITPLINDEK